MVLLHFDAVIPMSTSEPSARTLRTLAWTCLLLLLVVTSASAWLRLAQPRPACYDWPVCRASSPSTIGRAAAQPVTTADTESLVRAMHRLTATLALLVVVAMVIVALRQRPRDRTLCALTLALLTLALGLSALGIITPGSRAAAVLLGNMLGGLLMLALAWRLTRHFVSAAAPGSVRVLGWWALAGASLWAVQSGLGTLSGSFEVIRISIAHYALALAPGGVALGIGWLARRGGLRTEGGALMGVAVAQWFIGGAAMVFDAGIAAVLLHNFGAGLGLALLVGLIARGASVRETRSRP